MMKAVRIHSYGGPETLILEDAPIPEPQSDELLVRIFAAGVNPVDWKIREGLLGQGPLPQVMGIDFSGVVEHAGSNVSDFAVGDEVFGEVGEETGSYCEYTTTPVSHVARKPAAFSHAQVAALPVVSLTAWQALFETAHLRLGQKVLIHAATGGVGSFAVQFAKLKGARVIATASGASADFVRGLGADQLIDYHSTRFEDVVHDADLVFDTIGGETQERSFKAIKRGGMLVSIVQPPSMSLAQSRGVTAIFMRQKPDGAQLAKIADLMANGKVKVNVETVLPLSEARKAQEMSQSGHSHGKIVLQVAQLSG